MTPELVAAIKERIALSRSKEAIKAEVLGIGYTEEVFEEAYQAALGTTADFASSSVPLPTAAYAVAREGGSLPLISYHDMLQATWQLAKDQLPLFLKFIITNILVMIVGALVGGVFFMMGVSVLPLPVALFIGMSLLVLFWSFASIALIRAIMKRQTEESFTVHFKWALRHLFGLLVVSLSLMLIVSVGYVLFIIPGLMLLVYLFLTFFLYADDRASGMDTLVLSTAYVYGRFWPVVGRFLVLGIVLYVLTLAAMMLSALTFFLAPFVMAVMVFASYYLSYCGYIVLYESVIRSGIIAPLPIKESVLKIIYTVMAALGGIGLVGIILFVTFFLTALSASSF
jgi:hypothetical protein